MDPSKSQTPSRAVLRPRRRLNGWCAVDCALRWDGDIRFPGFMLPLIEGKIHLYVTKTLHVTCQPKLQR